MNWNLELDIINIIIDVYSYIQLYEKLSSIFYIILADILNFRKIQGASKDFLSSSRSIISKKILSQIFQILLKVFS